MMLRSFEMDARRAGFQQGITQGMRQGEARGSRQKALETAKNLLQFGLSIENIVKVTGLTAAEVTALK